MTGQVEVKVCAAVRFGLTANEHAAWMRLRPALTLAKVWLRDSAERLAARGPV